MIRNFLPQDKPKVLALLHEFLGVEVSQALENNWEWFFAKNPASSFGEPPFLITEHADELTGLLLSFPNAAYWKEERIPMYCIANFFVHPKKRGIGLRLAKAMIDQPYLLIGSPNKSSVIIWEYLNSLDWKKPLTLTKIMDSQSFLQKTKLPGINVVSRVINILLRTLKVFSPSTVGVRLEEADDFPKACDDLWNSVVAKGINPQAPSQGMALMTIRDQSYLQWRFVHCPQREYKIILAYREKKLTGYAVLRFGNKGGLIRGYVVDLLMEPNDNGTGSALLQAAESWFTKNKVQVIHCLIADIPSPWRTLLTRCGFLLRKLDHQLVASNNLQSLPKEAGLDAAFRHISYADGELDFVS